MNTEGSNGGPVRSGPFKVCASEPGDVSVSMAVMSATSCCGPSHGTAGLPPYQRFTMRHAHYDS